ncbi:hypothetical protein [Streptomyces sp. S584]|uniref:hypothetical protein n=1 Tax=Streptomyces sp. S584 TaxID=3096010 RepID=UPI002AFEE075|nr:hypothetical protein [Streptomyces sp. S584]
MGMFSRKVSTEQLRNDEATAASTCRGRATQVEATGQPIYGIDANGWQQRAETFEAAADDYQQQMDRKRR